VIKYPNSAIGVDIDGVISDIVGQIVLFARKLFGLALVGEQITSESADNCTELSLDQLHEIFRTRAFFQSMLVLPDAKCSLERILKSGWQVVLVTDRFWYPDIEDDTICWLRERQIPYDCVHFVKKEAKAAFSHRMGIHCFVEDQLSTSFRMPTCFPAPAKESI
jgi:5'(3')-deoxyribonucleotidase